MTNPNKNPMPGDRPEIDEFPAPTRQFHLSTALAFLAIASAAFALARTLDLELPARRFVEGFLASPWFSTINLAIYGVCAWIAARFFRRRILEGAPDWSNGVFFGTIYGGALFGMTLSGFSAVVMDPVTFTLATLFCGVVGTVWATFAAVVAQNLLERFETQGRRPWRAAAFGALVGSTAGFGSLLPLVLFWPEAFFILGTLAATFGGVCGARGAFLQATLLENSSQLPVASS